MIEDTGKQNIPIDQLKLFNFFINIFLIEIFWTQRNDLQGV